MMIKDFNVDKTQKDRSDISYITEIRKYKEEFKYMTFYDALTGLPNYAMLKNEINKLIDKKEKKDKFAITYIDIDNFKYINDTLGHKVGDEFLKYIANNLNAEIEAPNLVARLGGDEFAIIFSDIQSNELLLEKIERIKHNTSKTWSVNKYQFFVSMSIGVVIYPDNGDNITTLFKNADIAMYAAKREGKDKVLFYKKELSENNLWHIQMAHKIQSGIENEEFKLYYQPQFKLNTGEIIGVEALVRWIHPKEGFIPPMEFIPLAEETGQIYSIERWIIKNALQQKKQWEEQGLNHLELSINLSSKTLTSKVNFQQIEDLILSFNVDYSKVTLEITETAIISNVEPVIERLNRLKKKGLKIALDDFGTGYSSLTHLKKLPIDIIKLDRSFIDSIVENSKDTMIVKYMLSLAHDLKYKVVAEGIETREQLKYLKKHYCDSGQGYLLSKPLCKEEVNKLVKASFKFN
ncbi:EAL domain-containing protein [Clostridium bovifaecis]|uniref:EAL domain-containing protein n=1 Tax=Clostridium bovifaecis TaxID=2184719 RepID=A0A6I6FER4_9CLOT|nr:EAL domain-containing protein [Clostridium bovifaecis]